MKGAPLGDDLEALEQCPELDIFMTRDIDGKFLSIVKGENLTEIHGINFWLDGRIVITPKAEFTNDLDNLPFLARHLFKNDLYKRPDTGQPVTVITAAKGCPEECIFCSAPLGTGKTLRQRAPQSIVDEIRDCVQKYGIRNFLLAAETFTYNRKWAMEICDRIIERQLKVTWTCSTRVDRMDEELARRMKQSGCYSIALGIESGNQQTLDLMKKKATLEQAEKAIPIIHQAGIKTYQTYVIGFPWETREMIEQTIDFAIKLDGDITQFILALPLYGTELYEVTKKSDQLVKSGSFLHDYRIKNQYLSDEELDQLYRKAMRKFYLRPRYIFKTIKSLSSPAVLLRTATLGFGSLFQHLRSNPQGRLN